MDAGEWGSLHQGYFSGDGDEWSKIYDEYTKNIDEWLREIFVYNAYPG
ncbi:hypothetical protein [Anaerophaga thermohalophila]|nr:hypothetical protein [Anaerophaga thermohalophila]